MATIQRTKACQQCGQTFRPHQSRQRFCSKRCVATGQRRSETRGCLTCGASFSVKPSIPKRFCSPRCRGLYVGGRRPADPLDRFCRLVEAAPTGCWLWTGCLRRGYGKMALKTGVWVSAYRWAYEHFIGPIPAGLHLDHLCRVPRCVNPNHLEPVTHAENHRRARKTHCLRGHPLNETTTYWSPRYRIRQCRACQRARYAEKRRRLGHR